MDKIGAVSIVSMVVLFLLTNSVFANQAIIHKTSKYNAGSLRHSGITIVEDHGGFVLVALPQGVQDSMLNTLDFDYSPVVDGTTIIGLHRYPFDTQVGPSKDIPVHLKIDDYPMGTKGLYLVQFAGPIEDEWLEELKKSGQVEIIEYIPNNTYIVRMTPTDKNNIKSRLSMVRWIGIFQPAYKLSHDLQMNGGLVDVSFMVLDNPDGRYLANEILDQSVRQIQGMSNLNPYLSFKATVDASKLEEWTFDPNMYWIESWDVPQYHKELGNIYKDGGN